MAAQDTGEEAIEKNDYKLTFRISAEARNSLEWIASKHGDSSLSDALRRAIGTEKFLLEQQEKGSSILIEEKGGRIKELVFR